MAIRTLMYHALEPAGGPSQEYKIGDLLYVLPKTNFEAQMTLLKSDAFSVVDQVGNGADESLVDYAGKTYGTKKSIGVRLTFDDGHITNYTIAYPILCEYGYKAYFFLTTDWLNTGHYLTTRMVSELAGNGMVIGSHGVSHRFLTDLTETEIIHELDYSRKSLEDILGKRVELLSAPGGRINERVMCLAVAAGYKGIFLSDAKPAPSFASMNVYGRLAVKRDNTTEQVRRMLIAGKPLESELYLTCTAVAKKILGNTNYQNVREVILRLIHRRLV